ncbi:MAG: septum formation protein Maf [Deltaproteobacteria bacterium]|nr:septum formation protein Maf [Deltaproteobacteria bacterium]
MMSHRPINENNLLVLASISPRRKAILKQIGIPFEPAGSMIEETLYGETQPADIACHIAIQKVESIQTYYNNRWILGADTIVVINKTIFGKPKNPGECREMLHLLKGKTHDVITGFCIHDPGRKLVHLEAVMTKVKIKELSDIEIAAYINTGEPFGKAGAYAIQGIGSFMIEKINGSYTNVVGLPVYEVINALITCGALNNFPPTE